MDRIKKEMYMFFVFVSATYQIVKILVNNCCYFVAYTYVFSEKSPKNDQKLSCGHMRDITSRWSSKVLSTPSKPFYVMLSI